jgi:hypothetical protein
VAVGRQQLVDLGVCRPPDSENNKINNNNTATNRKNRIEQNRTEYQVRFEICNTSLFRKCWP